MENQKKSKLQMTNVEIAYLAGGCFWGMEDLFRKLTGVLDTDVGYMGGVTENPTYPQLRTGSTGHAESLKVTFDPSVITYSELILYFFKIHNPTTEDQQGNDIGSQYRSAIFYIDSNQKMIAENIIDRVNSLNVWPSPIVTEVTEAPTFWLAEEYHQDYLEKNPNGYTCHFERNFSFS